MHCPSVRLDRNLLAHTSNQDVCLRTNKTETRSETHLLGQPAICWNLSLSDVYQVIQLKLERRILLTNSNRSDIPNRLPS
jgi:hypothetical protein